MSSPAAALDVIDTRSRDVAVCDPNAPDADPLKASAGPSNLRGVFLAVATESGTVTTLDVYDMDLGCRAAKECKYPDPVLPVRPESRAAVMVRRHATRRVSGTKLSSIPTNTALFEAIENDCGAYHQLFPLEGGPPLTCGPSDPWRMTPDVWSVQYQRAIPGASSTSGMLRPAEPPEASDALVLKAPDGFDLCGRGVLQGDKVALLLRRTTCADNDPCSSVGAPKTTRAHGRGRTGIVDLTSAEARRSETLASCFPEFGTASRGARARSWWSVTST